VLKESVSVRTVRRNPFGTVNRQLPLAQPWYAAWFAGWPAWGPGRSHYRASGIEVVVFSDFSSGPTGGSYMTRYGYSFQKSR